MKYLKLFILLLSLLSNTTAIALSKNIHKKFYEEGLDRIYTATDKGLIISRIIDLPGLSTEDIYQKVTNYFVYKKEHENRFDHRLTYNTSNRITFHLTNRKNTVTIEEETVPIKKMGVPAHWCRYLFRIEVKPEKIRATLFLNFFTFDDNGNYALEVFPYTDSRVGISIKCLKEWEVPFTNILDSLKENILKDNELEELNKDW